MSHGRGEGADDGRWVDLTMGTMEVPIQPDHTGGVALR
jgi:hypothetical protein